MNGTGAADAARAPRAGRWRRSWPWLCAAVLAAIALFAPVLANDVPLCARVDGRWSFPAVEELVGRAPPGPGDLGWKQWHSQLPESSPDFAVFPPWSYGPTETDPQRMRAGPSLQHPLGNDDTGRDVLARLLRGARATVGISLCGVLLAAIVGTLLGALAGLRRGFADAVVMRLVEVFLCFPVLLMLLAVSACFGRSSLAVVAAFAATMWPSFARIVRGELLSLREREFVQVARHLGIGSRRLFTHHLLPQLKGQIGVVAAFCTAHAIIAESTLSFLGIGAGVQGGSWGGVLAQGKANAHLWVWHLWLFPGIAIVGTVMLCHVLADRLRPRE
jgi:ABC-type dipeptide/oligopeptide/nickel transport system permease subunit